MVEIDSLFHVRRAKKLSFKIISPFVVGAGEQVFGVSAIRCYRTGAMQTDIRESIDLSLLVACQYNGVTKKS